MAHSRDRLVAITLKLSTITVNINGEIYVNHTKVCQSFFFCWQQRNPVQTFRAANAISALTVNRDDSQIVVADGPSVRVWDHRQQMFLCQSFSPNDPADRSANNLRLHYKTVTALWVANNPDSSGTEVLLSASTDKLIKITHLSGWQELHQIRCPYPLTAVGASVSCLFPNLSLCSITNHVKYFCFPV